MQSTLGLTPRQTEMARLVAEGYSNGAIAAHLAIQPQTVAEALWHAYSRLGLADGSPRARLAYLVGLSDAGRLDLVRAACPAIGGGA